MDILFGRRSLVTLACHFQQAARSLHRALGGSWADFRVYHDPERRSAVQDQLEELTRLLPTDALPQSPCDRADICRSLPKAGLLGVLFGPWIARFKTRWRFRHEEVHFLASHLAAFQKALDTVEKPDAEFLIELRMNLTVCGCVIDCRAPGLPELARVPDLEHFDRTERLPALKIDEVVGVLTTTPAKARSRART